MPEFTIKVPAAKPGEYTITIGTGILGSVWPKIESQFGKAGKFVITDANVAAAGHLNKLLSGRDVPDYVITPAGESSKNMATLVSIIEAMERAYLGRDTVVVALGGGVVGDIAAFASAVFKRGVAVVQVPTTTLAQADSAIGGKTGVDSSLSKNAFGAFWHPSAVYIDVATLKTLRDNQYRAGLVESVKHAIIADEQYFAFLENNLDAILQRRADVLEKVAYLNCKIKSQVVEADPTETNQRRMLNYGHTIGHAIESASGFELLHGEAVAIGIIAAGMIEIEMGLGGHERLERVRKLLTSLGVPTAIPKNISKTTLMDIIRRDKKAINKWPRFVLIDKIGDVHRQEGQWAIEVGQDVVERALEKL
ncbi:MAG: 3-dehydroquinate synthase [Sedimentisphaerales bacterium]|jgi:3-dehydroquinate synthase